MDKETSVTAPSLGSSLAFTCFRPGESQLGAEALALHAAHPLSLPEARVVP